MKKVSENFIAQSLAARKKILTNVLIAWDKEFDPNRGFFILDESVLDGGAVLWNGNQDVAAFADRYKYYDESKYVAQFSVSQKASKHPWGVIQATAKITLNNASGRYSPGKTEGIGQFVGLPNRPVKIQQEIDGESVNIFTGYAHRPTLTIENSQLSIEAFDSVAFLSGMTSSLEPLVNRRIEEIIAMLLTEAGFLESQFSLEPGLQEKIAFCAPNGEKVLNLLQKLCESEQYLIFADGDGLIHGWNAQHFTINSEAAREFDTSNATSMAWGTTSILNDVKVKATPYKVAEKSGVFYSVEGSGDDYIVPAHDTLELFISPEDDNNNPIYGIEVNTPIYGESGEYSSYLTNTSTSGDGEPNNDAISLTGFYVMNGKTMRLIFSNSSDTPTYITKIEFYGRYAKKMVYSSTEKIDKSSVENYGINPDESTSGEVYEIENNYIQSREFATRVAELMVENYAEPYGEITVSVFPTPYLEFGDIVRTNTKMSDVGTANGMKRGIVFGVELSGSSNGKYTQKLIIEQRTNVYSFVLDESKLSSGDILEF